MSLQPVKNEFVWARDRDTAVSSARQKIEAAPRRNSTVSPNLSELNLSVELHESMHGTDGQ
jgi:hypothetical protein